MHLLDDPKAVIEISVKHKSCCSDYKGKQDQKGLLDLKARFAQLEMLNPTLNGIQLYFLWTEGAELSK